MSNVPGAWFTRDAQNVSALFSRGHWCEETGTTVTGCVSCHNSDGFDHASMLRA
jgi:cytochrome c553